MRFEFDPSELKDVVKDLKDIPGDLKNTPQASEEGSCTVSGIYYNFGVY